MSGHRPTHHLPAQPGPLWVANLLQSVAAEGPARTHQAVRPRLTRLAQEEPRAWLTRSSAPAPAASHIPTLDTSPAQAIPRTCTRSEPCLQALKDEWQGCRSCHSFTCRFSPVPQAPPPAQGSPVRSADLHLCPLSLLLPLRPCNWSSPTPPLHICLSSPSQTQNFSLELEFCPKRCLKLG